TEKTSVHPLAVRAMAERGIDISRHASKTYDAVPLAPGDYLVTVCDDANERCPFVPGAVSRLHWSLADPSRAAGNEEDRLAVFRRVRDQIEARIVQWLGQSR
ncbi:MAG TPA: arsenate reductase ArsC, partial [Dongiaceae bacterium]|nr:arsenate reductase ArsC [Dongiaceae bacterium]